MKLINLFIDELGSANPNNLHSKIYVLCGIMVTAQSRDWLRIKADQIKFKYWDRTDFVFHSREIDRKVGIFKNLKDKKINDKFSEDLIKFLQDGHYQLFGVLVDKTKMPKNWNEKTLYKKTADVIIKNFIFALLAQHNCRGRLIVESATAEKDFYYHKTAGVYLSNGFPGLKIDYQAVQNVLTEISFVTKKNFDIEEQLADLLVYGLKLKYDKRPVKKLSEYGKKLIKVVNSKLFKIQPNTGIKKKTLYSKIESFKILP